MTQPVPQRQGTPTTVMETWHLKPGFAPQAVALMQEMDDLVGPGAHEDPGWCGHASFFQSRTDPTIVHMIYPWRGEEEHRVLAAAERDLLGPFHQRYCELEREISYFTELPVDVDHDDH